VYNMSSSSSFSIMRRSDGGGFFYLLITFVLFTLLKTVTQLEAESGCVDCDSKEIIMSQKTAHELSSIRNNPIVLKVQTRFRAHSVVTIRGFLSTGTNWMRKLLLRNCPALKFMDDYNLPYEDQLFSVDADGLYGWKHGFFKTREILDFNESTKHSLIIITREALSWCVSAWKMGAMTHNRLGRTSRRRRGGIHYSGISGYIRMIVNEPTIPKDPYFQYYYMELQTEYLLDADNVFHARSQMYKNWMPLLNITEVASRIYFIRYEDLLGDTYNVFMNISKKLNLPCSSLGKFNFDPIPNRVKYGTISKGVNIQKYHSRFQFCNIVKDETVYAAMIDRIDRQFEKSVLGYDYPNTRKEYCKAVV